MKIALHRTTLALGLTLLAVLVPCLAWYFAGSREVALQTADLTETARVNARETGHRLARQLNQRLNSLLETEARRPSYHYQPYYHDPKGAAEGAAVVPSPLASAPGDPLVQVYFQVDSAGQVTFPGAATPALQENEPVQVRRQRADEELFLERQLERGLASILAAVRGESMPAQAAKTKTSAAQSSVAAGTGQRVEVLEQRAWAQNVEAPQLYNVLKSRPATAREPLPQQPATTGPEGNVEIYVGALKWRTVYVATQPALVALREVTTPRGAVLQGFLVSANGLAEYCKAAGLPARLVPGAATDPLSAPLALGDDPWHIAIDATVARQAALRQAAELRRGFLVIFLGGVGLALLAGVAVVGLVWQTERLARQRSQFAASAAHELRTPLAGLRMHADMLAEGLGDPTRSRDYARRLACEADRLGRVVANVLGFTRLERGTFAVQPAAGDLGVVVREGCERQRPALEAAGARLEVSVAADLPAVRFDRDAVAQLLQNLLDNAEKHTRAAADRTVHVTVATMTAGPVPTLHTNPNKRLSFRSREAGEESQSLPPAPDIRHRSPDKLGMTAERRVRCEAVRLTVQDHGAGLPANVRRHLFRPFERGPEPDAPAGIGLGLVLVKALAEAQGATVTYADAPRGGAAFHVDFPTQV